MDRLRYIFGCIERKLIFQPFWKILADFFHRLLYIRSYFQCIGSRQHIDSKYSRIFSIQSTFRRIRRGFKWNSCHITNTDNRAVWVGTDYNIFELLYRRQTSSGSNRQSDIDIQYWLFSQLTGCRLAILLFQGILQVLYCQPHIRQTIRINPDLHTVITATDIRNTAHTGNTTQYIQHVNSRKITQIDFVKTRIIRK